MSKNKNYGSYYKNPLVEQPAEETEEAHDIVDAKEPEIKEEVVVETQVKPAEIIQKTAAIVKGAKCVNIRSKASKESSVIVSVPENTAVKILDDSNKYWFKIEFKDKVGYMMSQFLKRV